jgi:multisubunit Na+/H+ antiporter MnhG subunit
MCLITQNGHLHEMPKNNRTHLFLEVELWESKYHKRISILVVVYLLHIVLQVVVLMSSVLMNRDIAEVYASRMMLLLAPVSASALSRCSLLLTMRLTTNSVIDC